MMHFRKFLKFDFAYSFVSGLHSLDRARPCSKECFRFLQVDQLDFGNSIQPATSGAPLMMCGRCAGIVPKDVLTATGFRDY
jgi:hypothetical protein